MSKTIYHNVLLNHKGHDQVIYMNSHMNIIMYCNFSKKDKKIDLKVEYVDFLSRASSERKFYEIESQPTLEKLADNSFVFEVKISNIVWQKEIKEEVQLINGDPWSLPKGVTPATVSLTSIIKAEIKGDVQLRDSYDSGVSFPVWDRTLVDVRSLSSNKKEGEKSINDHFCEIKFFNLP